MRDHMHYRHLRIQKFGDDDFAVIAKNGDVMYANTYRRCRMLIDKDWRRLQARRAFAVSVG